MEKLKSNKIIQLEHDLETKTRRCTTCREIKHFSEFRPRPERKIQVGSKCNECEKIREKIVRDSQTSEQKQAKKEYVKNWKSNKEGTEFLKSAYGLTLEDFKKMELEQNYVCAICKKPETIKRKGNNNSIKPLCVDHCHETGIVRGLLCHFCNAGLGYFKDSLENLKIAIVYLEKTK